MDDSYNSKICILITTYNGAKTVGKTIRGVVECLKTNLADVYIYDDCSTDNTLEIIKSCWTLKENHLIIKKNQRNLGLFQNKNKGLKDLVKQYDWVFLMHQDDIPYENWISTHLEVIEKKANEKTFVIWSSYSNYNYQKNKIEHTGDARGILKMEESNKENIKFYITHIYTPYCISGSVLNCKLLNKLNFFDEQYKHFGDTDFIVRGLIQGLNHIYIALPLIERTLSNFQASSINKVSFTDIKEMPLYFRKFSSYLNKNEKYHFYKYLLNIIARRFLKVLLKLELKKAFAVSFYAQKLTFCYLRY